MGARDLDSFAPNILDRAIGWVSPGLALRRHLQRQALGRAYEAASPGDKWRPRRAGASADADHQADAKALRDKARALVQNVPYIRAGLRSLVSNTIGTGIARASTAGGTVGDTISSLHAEWSEQCDADGLLTLAGLEAMAYSAAEVDGESLVRLRWRRPEDGLPVPLQLQVLEIDWLDTSKNGREGNDIVVNGIQYDMLGRRTAYWLFDQHPGAVSLLGVGLRFGASRPVPARDIIHFFCPDRPGSHRGFSGLASIIAPTRDLRLYQDAEIARKNLESRLAVIASGDPSLLADGPRSPDAKLTGELGALPSGGIFGVPEGVNITTVQPNAVPGYVDTVKFDLHLISAGWGVPYEDMTGDMRESTWTSARMRRVTYRRERECVQELHVIPSLCRRIDRAFIEAARLANKIDRRGHGFTYTPPRWDDVNPQQDAAADLTLVAAGLMTPSECIRRRGYDPKKVLAELRADIEAWREAGLLDVLLAMQKARALAGDTNDGGESANTTNSKPKAGSK